MKCHQGVPFWRSCEDPFAAVWARLRAWLEPDAVGQNDIFRRSQSLRQEAVACARPAEIAGAKRKFRERTLRAWQWGGWLVWLAAGLTAVVAMLAPPPSATAAITVTCSTEFCVDIIPCTLRLAIEQHNHPDRFTACIPLGPGGSDEIDFWRTSAHNIVDVYLDSPLPAIEGDLAINGNGVRLHGAYFTIAAGADVSFSGITDGKLGLLDYSTDRSLIFNDHGQVNISASSLVGPNTVPGYGGGISSNGGSVSVTNTTFSRLAAQNAGGAVYAVNQANIALGTGTVCKDNSAPDGSCVFARDSTVSIAGSDLIANHGSGGGRGGALAAENSQITISNSRLNNNTVGDAGGSGRGGAIYADKRSALTMNEGTACARNVAGTGGCLWIGSPKVVMDHVTCQDNRGSMGGCFYSDGGGAVTLGYSTCRGNMSSTGGCADLDGGAMLTATNSVIRGNHADNGGGIFGSGAEVMMSGSTVASNTAGKLGSGIEMENLSRLTAVNSTFADEGPSDMPAHGVHFVNSAANFISTTFWIAPLSIEGGVPGDLRNSILSNSAKCVGNLKDDGHNLQFPASASACATSIPVVDPQLDPDGLKDNGGPTPTVALLASSPAIGSVPLAACTDQNGDPLRIDQRGFPRPGFGQTACAAGAYEFSPPPLDCKAAVASAPHPVEVAGLFLPEHIEGLSNPYGTLAVTITGVTQDKPVRRHTGAVCANAFLAGSDTAFVRLESGGTGGLLYRLAFTAADPRNAAGKCGGEVPVCVQDVAHAGHPCVDTGQTYDATQCPH